MWPLRSSFWKKGYLCLHNVSCFINIWEDRFLNECAKKLYKIPQGKVLLWDVNELMFVQTLWFQKVQRKIQRSSIDHILKRLFKRYILSLNLLVLIEKKNYLLANDLKSDNWYIYLKDIFSIGSWSSREKGNIIYNNKYNIHIIYILTNDMN